MPLTEPYELDGVTIGSGEVSVVSGDTSLQTVTDDGLYQFWIDPANMAKGDQFVASIYEKVLSSGTKRLVDRQWLYGAQAQALVFPPVYLLHGWDMTLVKVAGSDRAFDASIRRLSGGTNPSEFDSMSGVTVSTSPISVISGTTSLQDSTSAGVYQLWVDPFNMAKGDAFIISIFESVEATGGAQRLVYQNLLFGAQAQLWKSPPLILMNGWDMTITKAAGTDRDFDASIRKVG